MAADRLDVDDPNATVLSILGSRGHDAHRLPVPLDPLAHLELVVEPGRRAFCRAAVDVNDVLERGCHRLAPARGRHQRRRHDAFEKSKDVEHRLLR